MNKPVEALMQKEMSRKEFLMTLGFGVASVLGFSHIIQLLTGKSVGSHLNQSVSNGYGSTNYGGGRG